MAAQFKFFFVAMGQGDCCLVKCPDGKIVVVDCGRSSSAMGNPDWITEAMIALRGDDLAGKNSNKVDALILTHSDIDHHNLVVTFFNEFTMDGDMVSLSTGQPLKVKGVKQARIGISNIYVSNAHVNTRTGEVSPLAYYDAGGLNLNVIGGTFSTARISEVTINSRLDVNNYVRYWEKDDNFTAIKGTTPVVGKKFTILNGRTENTDWRISIIAGNVPKGYENVQDGATEDNAKSLITLFEIGQKKALLMGDATFSTEKFLRENHAALLKDIELAAVPHHGSSYASGRIFVFGLEPRYAVVSVGFVEHNFRHPNYDYALVNWLEALEKHGPTVAEHDIDYWTEYTPPPQNKPILDKDLGDMLNSWTKDLTDLSLVDRNKSGNCWWLKQPVDGVFGLYQFTKNGRFLFREVVDTSLNMTSQKTQFYTLTSAGIV